MTHLHVHSRNGSFYDGVSDVTELVDQVVAHGDKAMALTDHGQMGGLFKFQEYAKKKGIKPILGVEAYAVEELVTIENEKRVRTPYTHIILLAKDKIGWQNLCHLNYLSNKDKDHFYYKPRITFDELFQYKEGIMVGSACLASVFSRYLLKGERNTAEKWFKRFVDELGENFYAELQFNELEKEQKLYDDFIIEMSQKYNVITVLTGDVHYATPEGANTQSFIFSLQRDKEEDDTYKCKHLFYQSINDFKTFNRKWNYNYSDEQIEQWCANTDLIAEKCNYTVPLGTGMKLPSFYENEEKVFEDKAKEGLAKYFDCTYEECPENYRKQLEYEINILLKKGAFKYMLTVQKLIQYAKDNKYMLGPSRGSAGGSLVNCCLGITSWCIDPVKNNLIFERFVSEDRLVTNIYKYYVDDNRFITKNNNHTYEELEALANEKIKQYPEYKDRLFYELRRAKMVKDEISIYDEIIELPECDNRYVLPFFLGKTTYVDLTKPLEIVQLKEGGSGGLDIDTDYEPKAKEAVKKWLLETFGEEQVLSVGTYGTVGVLSAIKDILRKENVSFFESNEFAKNIDPEKTFEENMEEYKNNFPDSYKVYLAHKDALDMTSKIVGQVRQVGTHAGGVVIVDKPIWNYIPVVHSNAGLATAFQESGTVAELDELGIIKIDCLSIACLDTISNAIDLVDEELVKIKDDDGLIKIVPRSYIDAKLRH